LVDTISQGKEATYEIGNIGGRTRVHGQARRGRESNNARLICRWKN